MSVTLSDELIVSKNSKFRGGKIYPHYYNTVYVSFGEYGGIGGRPKIRYPSFVLSGAHVKFTDEELLNPPPHLRVLDVDSSGIEPYQFLNIPKRRGVK